MDICLNRVKNSRHWDDVLSSTPQGTEWTGTNKKIYGFGIDIDSRGQLVYDESRLHAVMWPYATYHPIHCYRGPLADTEVCDYILISELDRNCRVDFQDVALMAGNWLIDCHLNPQNPACVPE
jgi:hypothetical protein